MNVTRPIRALRLLGVATLLAIAAAPAGNAAAARGPAVDDRIDVVAFNVLAPIWAAPVWYPSDLDPALLGTEYRRDRVTAFLRERAATAEVVALQEVQDSEFPYLAKALGPDFVGVMSTNHPDWWSAWVVDGLPWKPNGTAVFVRTSVLRSPRFSELDLSDGNSMALVTARHGATGRIVRVASVHLDSDVQPNRAAEVQQLIDAWGAPSAGGVDIIAGDFNEDAVTGSVAGIVDRNGYVSVLAAVGNREPTHPFGDSYNNAAKWGIIDHIIVRNGTPLDGDVIDSGLWSIAGETDRIEANLSITGSDHFPLIGGLRPGS